MTRMDRSTIRALLIGAAVLDIAFPAVVVTLDILQGTNAWHTTLSLHSQRPGFPWMDLAFLINALALALLADALRRLPPMPWAAPTCLVIAASSSALLSLFGADPNGVETVTGHLHDTLAPLTFLGIAGGALLASHAHRSHPAWRGHWVAVTIFTGLLLASLAAFGLLVLAGLVDPHFRSYYGGVERLVVVSIGGWVVATAVQGVRVTRRLGPVQSTLD